METYTFIIYQPQMKAEANQTQTLKAVFKYKHEAFYFANCLFKLSVSVTQITVSTNGNVIKTIKQ